MKYVVKYMFLGSGTWYTYSEHQDFFEAKSSLKKLKKHMNTADSKCKIFKM